MTRSGRQLLISVGLILILAGLGFAVSEPSPSVPLVIVLVVAALMGVFLLVLSSADRGTGKPTVYETSVLARVAVWVSTLGIAVLGAALVIFGRADTRWLGLVLIGVAAGVALLVKRTVAAASSTRPGTGPT